MKPLAPVGIVSYGTYIPRNRIKTADISEAWQHAGQEKGLGVYEKAVAGKDEDTVTMAVAASRQALERLKDTDIGAIYVGSESHPYAVKPTAAIVGEALGIPHTYTAADFEFACKAGTAAIQVCSGLVSSGMIKNGLAVGSDVAQSKAGDALEYAAASAAGAYIIGAESANQPLLARLLATCSRTYDVPDFWRRAGQSTPSHGGRFTGEPAYYRLIRETVTDILNTSNLQASDIDHVVFHMPNAKFCTTAAKKNNFTIEQLAAGFTVPEIGNSYSACSLVGFAKVLDVAVAGQKILLCSFGSGAGSDAFIWEVTSALEDYRKQSSFNKTVAEQIATKSFIDYTTYCKLQGKIRA